MKQIKPIHAANIYTTKGVPTSFTLKIRRFSTHISLNPLSSNVRTLFALQLFAFYSPLIDHTRALTWCTRDNPVCAAPVQK